MAKDRELRTLRFSGTLPFDGEQFAHEQTFAVEPVTDDPRYAFAVHDVYNGIVSTGYVYYIRDWGVFETEWKQKQQQRMDDLDRAHREWAQAEFRLNEFKASPYHQALRRAFDDGDWTLRLFETAIQDVDDAWKFFQEVMTRLPDGAMGSKREAVEVRKLLKHRISEAKEALRSEYPDEYREEEDKEDFYESHFEDLAAFLAQQL